MLFEVLKEIVSLACPGLITKFSNIQNILPGGIKITTFSDYLQQTLQTIDWAPQQVFPSSGEQYNYTTNQPKYDQQQVTFYSFLRLCVCCGVF